MTRHLKTSFMFVTISSWPTQKSLYQATSLRTHWIPSTTGGSCWSLPWHWTSSLCHLTCHLSSSIMVWSLRPRWGHPGQCRTGQCCPYQAGNQWDTGTICSLLSSQRLMFTTITVSATIMRMIETQLPLSSIHLWLGNMWWKYTGLLRLTSTMVKLSQWTFSALFCSSVHVSIPSWHHGHEQSCPGASQEITTTSI